jgi:hypothetical protein
MQAGLKDILWKQFGASIDMLENAISACPAEVWDGEYKFWYKAYHSIFYLDYYCSPEPESFAPPPPYGFSEFDPSGILPDRVYSKEELLTYIEYARKKCYDLVDGLTDELAGKKFIKQFTDYSMLEMMIYTMRHVQHHVGQLNLVLRQQANSAPGWVSRTSKKYWTF